MNKDTRNPRQGGTKERHIVLPPSVPRYRLTDLLKDTTPETLRAGFEWDDPRGREAI